MNSGNLLFLDTTSNALRIGVSRNGTMAWSYNRLAESHRYHSSIMIPLIQDGLKEAGLGVKDLTALAVNIGPGSFTGIRTGITSARTMAQFLKLPVYAFNTFELLAAGQLPEADEAEVYLDALRGRAYFAALGLKNGCPELLEGPTLVTLQDWDVSAGRALLMEKTLAGPFEKAPVTLIDEQLDTPAVMMKLLENGAERYLKPWAEISPLYIQSPNITQRKAKPGTFK